VTEAPHAVLVVDDEPQLRHLLRTTLAAEGFRVVEAETARRALIEAASHKPDLVILDLGLPDADGGTVVSGIREWSTMPIVVLSALWLAETFAHEFPALALVEKDKQGAAARAAA